MDIIESLKKTQHKPLTCVEMHTCGEPTRIVISGHPALQGTLLEQRAQAKAQYDHIRRRVMLEPRGHYDMYGAILRADTELTRTGEAHMGVLFTTNDGYSSMCGHATIALGRFLVDTHDLDVFPRRNEIQHEGGVAVVNLHAPCGLLRVSVPVNEDGSKSDPTKPVSFVSVPSFATGLNVPVTLSKEHSWPEAPASTIEVDFAYGGAFFGVVEAPFLGFDPHLQGVDQRALTLAATNLKKAVLACSELARYFKHPDEPRLSALYSVIIKGEVKDGPQAGNELGVCFYADAAIDRSPTGSGVSAREAIAYARDSRHTSKPYAYHSLVSAHGLNPPFVARVVSEEVSRDQKRAPFPMVRVQVEGHAYYSGTSVWSIEPDDPLGDSGFKFQAL
jgi:trans-L-3-hydroxyproline dehydratase